MILPVATTSETFLRLGPQSGEDGLPDYCIDAGGLILQAEIGVAGRMRPAIVGNFAAHAHEAETILDRSLQSGGEFADAEFGRVAWSSILHGARMQVFSAGGK